MVWCENSCRVSNRGDSNWQSTWELQAQWDDLKVLETKTWVIAFFLLLSHPASSSVERVHKCVMMLPLTAYRCRLPSSKISGFVKCYIMNMNNLKSWLFSFFFSEEGCYKYPLEIFMKITLNSNSGRSKLHSVVFDNARGAPRFINALACHNFKWRRFLFSHRWPPSLFSNPLSVPAVESHQHQRRGQHGSGPILCSDGA